MWTLALGLMQDRKRTWVKRTVEGCLKDAEKSLL